MVRNGQKHRHRIVSIKNTSASHRYQKLTIVQVYRGNIREMRKSGKICHIQDTGLRNKSNFRPEEENLIENNR